jgi:filamentous hemagglutinin family protein
VSGAIATSFSAAFAQVTRDSSLGTVVTRNDTIFQITGGRPVGDNLFHSFSSFSVPDGEIADFLNNPTLSNIFARVTGGSASDIQGLIRAQGNTNLFLINPNGIIFGPNAQLNIGGSFVGTTANAIAFPGGAEFSLTSDVSPDNPLLTVNPSAFLFNQIAAQQANSIEVRGNLAVAPNQSLLLVGGTYSPTTTSTGKILIEGGSLNAPGGRVELGGVLGVGTGVETVGLSVDGNNLRLSFPDDIVRTDVSLTNGASVDVTAGGDGSISVNARNLDVVGGSSLRAGIKPLSGFVNAQAGDITLNATGTIKIDNGFIYNAVFGNGNGGNLTIDTGQLILKDGVVATASVSQGRAGNLTVTASDSVNLTATSPGGTVSVDIPVGSSFIHKNVSITVPIGLWAVSVDINRFINPNAISLFANLLPQPGGNAGNLTINTRQLLVQGGATVVASTVSNEQGGNLIVNAWESIQLSGTSSSGAPSGNLTIDNVIPSGLRNEALGSGPNGDLIVNTGRLIIQDGAFLTAGTAGGKPGGNLTVNASESVELIGTSSVNGIPSVLVSGTRRGGDSINLTINTERLIVRDGAVVSAGTSSVGRGGNLTVNAKDSVELIGTASVPLNPSAYNALLGDSGVSVFGVTAGRPVPSGLITGTAGQGDAGDAGNLTINTQRLVIRDGAQASVSTFGAGNAGSLTVNASSVELAGTSKDGHSPNDLIGSSLLTTAVSQGATGNGGNLTIETEQLIVRDGAAVSVSSEGSGDAGNLEVTSRDLLLDNRGVLRATTSSGEGGNIEVRSQDLILMRRNSEISTEAAGTGNGGDIKIDADFIVAVPSEDSDIVADAFEGNGGNIRITTQGIYGLEYRDRRTPKSDITASSDFGIDGIVEINTPDIDPNRGLVNLPVEPINTELAQGCQASGSQQPSKFVIIGRGGLPSNPKEALGDDAVEVDLVRRNPHRENRSRRDSSTNPTNNAPTQLVEAQGWVIGDNGEIILTATAPPITLGSSWQRAIECDTP